VHFFFLLLVLGALGQVSSDLYLPSMPAISESLNMTINMVQLSFSTFLMGFSIAQLIYAPLSDVYGRRRPVLCGIIICLIGTIGCLSATHSLQLLASRFIQGLGAGVGDSLSRAILRDRYSGDKLARWASYLGIGHVAILAAAPFVGGYIQHFVGWRGVFSTLVLYDLLLFIAIFRALPETNRLKGHLTFKDIRQNVCLLIKSRKFVSFSLITALVYGGIIAWLTVAPALLELELGFRPQDLGWFALLLGIIFALGSFLNAKKVSEVGLFRMIAIGLSLMMISGLLLSLLYWKMGLSIPALIFPVALFLFAASFVFSNGFAYALDEFSDSAGLGCALFTFIQILGGVISSSLMASLHTTTQITLSFIMCGFTAAALLILIFAVDKPRL
jgi:Bcr/CflA subfamily drug resistance transporter